MQRTKLAVCALLLSLSAFSAAQNTDEPILVNQNRIPAGEFANGVLTIHLEIRQGTWHPEAEDGPRLYVQAFGETGKPAQIPGPLLRVPAGTTIHLTVSNKLKIKATVYGLNTRPGDIKDGTELAAGESRELTFAAGAPGTYYYWARTNNDRPNRTPLVADAQLNGAFIVDAPGPVPPDRIFVIDAMVVFADAIHPNEEILSINGKLYPSTERLEYTQGQTVRWRVINTSFGEHPMHLHGSFFQVLSQGDFESDTAYPHGERQWAVTQNIMPYHTAMLEWTPSHPGRWLFHCHFHAHITADNRVPLFSEWRSLETKPVDAAMEHSQHDNMSMPSMAGLVMQINVKPAPDAAQVQPVSARVPRKIDLVIEPGAATGKSPTFSCAVREGKKLVASQDESMGPAIVVTRGEPTEVTVLNHLKEPTIIHWHGLELDSYYDGVMGGGEGKQVTRVVAPGESFTARFTPNRAGTFIYHTHAADPDQLSGGIYGPLIVLEPGEAYDPTHDKVLVIGSHDLGFFATRLTLNGTETPGHIVLQRGTAYRFRVINIGSELRADLLLGTKEKPESWLAVAKDGATLPPRLTKTGEAKLHIVSGETYDFRFKPESVGEIPLEIRNEIIDAKVATTVVVK